MPGSVDSKKSRQANRCAVLIVLAVDQFGTLIAEATDKWAKVIKFADIKAE